MPRDAFRIGATVLALLLTLVPASAADTDAELDAARARLGELEDRIASQEARVGDLSGRLGELTAALGRARAEHAAVRTDLRRTQAELHATRVELAALKDRIASRASDVYKHGALHWLEILLGADSIGDLNARVVYASRLVGDDSQVVLRADRLRDGLEVKEAEQDRLLREEAAHLRTVKREHREIEDAFTEQQERLDDLASARSEVQGLVSQLRDKLAAEELARLGRVAGKGMPITFGEWAGHLLGALGAPETRSNLVAVVAWQTAEYTEATWNPLATTMPMPGATRFNSHGVRNFTSLEQGIQATLKTLGRPGHRYEAIVASLRAGADAMDTARAINASDWCRGCAGGNYVTGLIPAVSAYYERYANR